MPLQFRIVWQVLGLDGATTERLWTALSRTGHPLGQRLSWLFVKEDGRKARGLAERVGALLVAQPLAKRDRRALSAYTGLDFQATQTRLLATALAAYFATHPDAYAVYRYESHGGESFPAHLRDQAGDGRQSADDLVLFTKVVDDPELRDLARLRALDRPAFQQHVLTLARAAVRKSDELKDCSDGVALDMLFSYREDLYRLWQEKAA